MVQFAPLNIPISRRLQTAAVIFTAAIPLLAIAINFLFIFSVSLWVVYIPYILWYLIFDRHSAANGNRISDIVRRFPLWQIGRDYFPATVVKTAELDPKKHYLFAMHPHGVIGMSLWANFLNAVPGTFESQFPGVDLRCGTLKSNFYVPFLRELLLWFGLVTVEKSTILGLLKRGKSVLLMVGGAEESLYARPGIDAVVLSKRKGFVKCALETGASLVPIFGFGENGLYSQAENPEGSKVRKVQDFLKKYTKITMPAFYGRGIFQYDYGIIPRRVPLRTVVGAPIDVPLIPNPSQADVEKYHAIYVEKLTELHRNYRESGDIKVM